MLGNWFKHAGKYAPIPLRIVLGIAFILHGLGKFGASPGLENFGKMLAGVGVPAAAVVAFIVASIELVGGIFLLAGFLTRYAALLIGLVMVFAIVLVKRNMGFIGGYELDLAFLAGAISLLMTGGGSISIDGLFKKDE